MQLAVIRISWNGFRLIPHTLSRVHWLSCSSGALCCYLYIYLLLPMRSGLLDRLDQTRKSTFLLGVSFIHSARTPQTFMHAKIVDFCFLVGDLR